MDFWWLTKIIYAFLSHIVAYRLTFLSYLQGDILNFNVAKLIRHSTYNLDFFSCLRNSSLLGDHRITFLYSFL